MRIVRYFSFLIAFIFTLYLQVQAIPAKPNPPRLVNDFCNFLQPNEINALEQELVTFDDSTSTQIAVVIVRDLEGYDKANYAYMIAQDWGIGQKGKNNGVLLLIKPKTTESRGEVFIATGYGLEGALPDAVCKRIVENEIIPNFKQGDYLNGIQSALVTIMSLTKKEYTADAYMKKTSRKGKSGSGLFLLMIIGFFVIFALFGRKRDDNQHTITGGSSLPWWLLLMGMGSGRSGGSNWGDFSSGGGDFGGFGGGSFGGGGAGGSW